MKIFFDLDGTIIDAKKRLFELFKDLTPECDMSYEEYWAVKTFKIDHESMLKKTYRYTQDRIDHFQNQWDQLIETKKYFAYDTIIPGSKLILETYCNNHELFVVTGRQFHQNTIDQLNNLGIGKYFIDVFTVGKTSTKIEAISNIVKKEHFAIVGDTEVDILTGKHFGGTTISVTTGFRHKQVLKQYNPDAIISSVVELPSIIEA